QADFSYQSSFGSKGPVAYETLLLDTMRGDATLFTRRDEVEAEWRIITPIEAAWANLPVPDFHNYAAGSEGPTSWHDLLKIRGNTAEQTDSVCISRLSEVLLAIAAGELFLYLTMGR